MSSSNNITAAHVVSQQFAAQLNKHGDQLKTKAKKDLDTLLSSQLGTKHPTTAVKTNRIHDPLADFQPKASNGAGMAGFSGTQEHLGTIEIVAIMMATYESSQTIAATSMLQINSNLESQLNTQLNSLLKSGEEAEDIQQVLQQEESREDVLRYAMQAVMAVVATGIGFMIGGPVGAAVALTVCVFNDVMTDTGGWDDVCNGIDNALGVSGKEADAVNAVVKIGTSLVIGIASGGIAGIGMAVGDTLAATFADAGEEMTFSTAMKKLPSAVSTTFKDMLPSFGEKGVAEGLEDLGEDVAEGVPSSIVDDSMSVLSDVEDSVDDDVESLDALSKGDDLVRDGGKEDDRVRERKGHKAVEEEAKGESSGESEPTTKKKAKIGKRTVGMGVHEGIQVMTSFKTSDGSDGQETGFMGDIILACGGPQWLATAGDVVTDLLGAVGDLVSLAACSKDAASAGTKLTGKAIKGLTIVSAGAEATLTGINGVQQIKIAKQLRELAPISEETDEEVGLVQATMMEQQQNSQALSGLMDTTEQWASMVQTLLNDTFQPADLMFQA